ncbi:Tm-1-like ATP-binding domain-containing protein [Cellulophaga sp. F20128]|uniref:Tm-1-like ATP-binding domain-containing protein n=1 Tax=Cellulophaga sp. F20128 TaxID=2926413 RepID=UPI001FF2CDD7|nr:Tm-1-like ATP-binding domain-containing protein [Cellulophaga sp. F20128]MCK0158284.1 Tm-1-like ATP-binding domain-containing protein [Cellulophaga sp. F20128]
MKDKKIVILGCFDTKGEDFTYLLNCLNVHYQPILTINVGVMETSVDFYIDVDNETVAAASGTSIEAIRASNDRGKAVELMGRGAAVILADLVAKEQIKGVVGMGGGGGTYIILEAMQAVPLGIPKLCLSTVVAKDLSRQIGVKDITMMSSVVDVAGLNKISRLLIRQAAAAISGMSQVIADKSTSTKKNIAISMFGNTTKCVDKCTELLKEKKYEVMAFHATGVGGTTMEALIREGVFDAVLDVTTTELADELCEGILSAGPNRLTAASEMGIPQVVVPGCLDMVNFAQIDTLPEKYKLRKLYSWAPDVTLMRTNINENKILGKQLVDKLKKSKAPVEILIPLKGISQIDKEGDIFYDQEADNALFQSIRDNAKGYMKVLEMNAHINDDAFAKLLVDRLLKIVE